MADQNIDLWVSAGSFEAPYYRFYTDSGGSQELRDLSLDTSKSYTFRRLNEATSHPFYLSDTGYNKNSSDALLITGYGSPSQGITGNESFKVEFGDSAGDVEELLYYCSSHQSMQGNIALEQAMQYPTVRGNSIYSLIYEDHPKYENPWEGELGFATEPRLAWYSWGKINQDAYRKSLVDKAVSQGGNIASLDNEQIYSLWMDSFFNKVSFSAYVQLEDGGLGVANLRKNVTGGGSENYPLFNAWTDSNDSGSGYGPEFLIAEIPFIRRGDSAYVIVEGPTWEEAEANAIALGGHLVTINDADENEWIAETFKDHNLHYEVDRKDQYWTGLIATEPHKFQWSSGQEYIYENFGEDQPSGDSGYGEIILDSTNSGWRSKAGSWER